MRTFLLDHRRRLLTFTLVGILTAASTALAADSEPPPSPAELEKKIKNLEEQVDRLNHETRQHETSIDTLNRFPLAQWKDGFIINNADNSYKLKIGAYTQADGRFFLNDGQDRNTSQFTFRRARLDIQGTVAKYFDFRILPDFAGSNFVLFDAYVDVNYIPEAKLRVGKFKPPLGLERLEPAYTTMFIERGLPTNLVPTRDNGIQLFSDLWNGALSYQLGIFNGTPDLGNTATDANDDKDFAGRLFLHPFRFFDIAQLSDFGFGLAGSYGHERGTSSVSGTAAPVNNTELPSYRSFGQATVFSYSGGSAGTPATTTCDANNVCTTKPAVNGTAAAVASGDHSRINPEAYFYYGPFGFQTEWVSSKQEVSRPGPTNPVDRHNLNHRSYHFAASWVLTGEPASYRGVIPFEPFDPFQGKWGAFEVAARFGELDIDDDAFRYGFASRTTSVRRVEEYVGGLNWYLNRNVKFVLDYATSDFTGGAGTTKNLANRKTEQAVETRVQLQF
ncbi:MAG TPA: porin [Candidatus Acidoferrales bacterium]|nr:porin [Candidatus Acidoferrales bacterium]